ncbi:GNAT family N-acetyltransferase [Vibrio alginolyticus]|uniref:GNAT family N-acetyltransferase n=1 Tax=Vibrio alginolyticus TaxID=663 RepID=UPI001BD531A0|nr:GNAT family N-acetyltransferase [Vibrio alginolyticus]EIJ2379441.1 GNAT family N-acetyltransferase [Vibrio alginolyticus]MBS9875939.1 GNAT family N-acetyltransferase [Vibrio alginolyticus]
MMKVRKAVLDDLPYLINFTAEEAREAEGSIKIPETLEKGILVALRDPSIATYWVLADENNTPVGSVSAVREWSDWNAGYYWWIQSMFLSKSQRGKGRMSLLLDAVKHEMKEQKGLELRLYVHKDNSKAVRAYQNAHFSKSDYEVMVLSD